MVYGVVSYSRMSFRGSVSQRSIAEIYRRDLSQRSIAVIMLKFKMAANE